MLRGLILATLIAVVPGAAPSQELGVLHIKVTLTDAGRTAVPVPRHALLISDNPSTAAPRRILTAPDGTAEVRLRPGSYTVESDEPVAFDGKGYQWTKTLEIAAGREIVLELTAANAEVGAAPAPSTASVLKENDPSLLLPEWKDSVVAIWTPESHASGLVIDAAGFVLTNLRSIGNASAVEVQLTPSVKVAARVLVADRVRDVAVLWIDPTTTASVRPVPLNCMDRSKTSGPRVIVINAPIRGQQDMSVPVDDACTAVASAQKAMQTAQRPLTTRLPVEPLQPFPADALDAAVKRRAGALNPPQMSSSDFDITFLTPVSVYGAQHDFGAWSEYFADVPPVLVIRVTPKLAESFWTTIARGAAYTQGVALPPIKHFKPGFLRMQVSCGDAQVTPIHPFTLEQRISDTDAIHEGLYVFVPQALGPHCKSVKLTLYSEKEPKKPISVTVDPQIIQRIWQDVTPL